MKVSKSLAPSAPSGAAGSCVLINPLVAGLVHMLSPFFHRLPDSPPSLEDGVMSPGSESMDVSQIPSTFAVQAVQVHSPGASDPRIGARLLAPGAYKRSGH